MMHRPPRSHGHPHWKSGGVLCIATTLGCFSPPQDSGLATTATPLPGSTDTDPADSTSTSASVDSTTDEGSTSAPTTGETVGLDSSSGGGAMCGNGRVEGDEECDLGAGNGDTQACTSQCRDATCGDGLLWAGEEGCDDAGQSAECDADCSPAVCGDGTINDTAGEQCEADGPGFACIACQAQCTEGTANCNRDLLGDGCEADLGSLATCGDCMTSCVGDQECIGGNCLVPSDAVFLFTEHNVDSIWQWEPMVAPILYHQAQANDVDCNLPEGSASAWVPEHFNDIFGSFTPGAGVGLDAQFGTPFAYPKHITVFNNEIVVMSRNDATIHRYSTAGALLGSTPTGNGTGQGMATDGVQLWASFWDGASSFFVRYDAAIVAQAMIANPNGLGGNVNVFDIAYDGSTGNFFGLATNSESGTGTSSSTVVEFEMGGMVLETHALPLSADGIGQSACP
ncbi:MAG: hypothetical protein K0V04_11445 [Deltaproteobacteria bacterium]|nr:hypothetical protein [Deltaproteobacteria bacterium]